VEQALTQIDVAAASATETADKEFILKECEGFNNQAGFLGFNALLQGIIKEWLAKTYVVDARIERAAIAQRSSASAFFKCGSATATDVDPAVAAKEAFETVKAQLDGRDPTVIIVHCTATYDVNKIAEVLHFVAPASLICGGTSSATVMSGTSSFMDSGTSLVLFAIFDPDGHYALASGPLPTTENVADSCKAQVGLLPGNFEEDMKIPRLVMSVLAPGTEEAALLGVKRALGPVPVFGGTSADNDLSASWRQISGKDVTQNGFSLLLMWFVHRYHTFLFSCFDSVSTGLVSRLLSD
jgi:hypothetical protein